MKMVSNKIKMVVISVLLTALTPILAEAGSCDSKLFTVTIDSKLSIGDAIENLADTCDLTVTVKDEWAKKRLDNKLYFVKLKNTSLDGFLDTILKENDLDYTLNNDRLSISYLSTKTFRVHYISGSRTGNSSANVTIANSGNGAGGTGGDSGGSESRTGIEIISSDEFKFWKTVESEVQRILIGAADGSTHYTKNSDTKWTGPNGREWEYNPLAPIVNPDAGMITVTGTSRQISRVGRYIETLKAQIRKQVLIDVRIITVTFDNSKTTGVDWSQLYNLQNVAINSYVMGQKNISKFTSDETGLSPTEFALGTEPKQAAIIEAKGSMEIQDVVKFLATQGDVRAVSSPRVMTLNNQPALISVGKELFYKIKSSSTTGGDGGAVGVEGETVDSVFAGVLLDITPEINNDGMITLKINPSITDTLEPISTGAGTRTIPPDLIRRQIASVIKIKDGHHAILGGLITTQTGTKINKVPLLGDIPLFSHLFKKEESIEKVVELVLVITPHIIHNGKDVSLKELGYKKVNGK